MKKPKPQVQSPAPKNIPEVILKRLSGMVGETQQASLKQDFYGVCPLLRTGDSNQLANRSNKK